jgi:hypothetical protein
VLEASSALAWIQRYRNDGPELGGLANQRWEMLVAEE